MKDLQGTPSQVRNPAGFIISLIASNNHLPEGFETKVQKQAREERERKEGERHAAKEVRQQLEWEYDEYRDAETDRYIEANTAQFEALKNAKWKEDREKYAFATESMARMAARFEMQKRITFLTFDEFLERKKQGTDLFLKPVGPSPAPEPATRADEPEDMLAADEAREAVVSKPVVAAEVTIDYPVRQPETEPAAVNSEAKAPTAEVDPPNAISDTVQADTPESATMEPHPAVEAAKTPARMPEEQTLYQEPLMIEFVSDPPQAESGGATAEQGIA